MEPEVWLRRPTPEDLEQIVRWHDAAETDDPFDFFGHRAPAADGGIGIDGGRLAVEHDGVLVGEVSWFALDYGPPPMSRALNIGIAIAPAHRGRGLGTAAQRTLAAYLFDTYPVHRVEASTDVENVAEQRALEKAGFTREGVLRGAQWRAGAWHDLVGYAMVRGD
jgi:RimJ/RimL family protein N-acetyltransferase